MTSRARRAASTLEPSSSPTSTVRCTNGSSCASRRHWQPSSQRQTGSGYQASASRTRASSPVSSRKTAHPDTPSRSCCGVTSQSAVASGRVASTPSSATSHSGSVVTVTWCWTGTGPQPYRTGQSRNVSGSPASILPATAATSASATNTCTRGPQPWSVERAVSNPSTSDPVPISAAECGTSPISGPTASR
jgi:hypothetical protein